jgi:cell division protein FtsB
MLMTVPVPKLAPHHPPSTHTTSKTILTPFITLKEGLEVLIRLVKTVLKIRRVMRALDAGAAKNVAKTVKLIAEKEALEAEMAKLMAEKEALLAETAKLMADKGTLEAEGMALKEEIKAREVAAMAHEEGSKAGIEESTLTADNE